MMHSRRMLLRNISTVAALTVFARPGPAQTEAAVQTDAALYIRLATMTGDSPAQRLAELNRIDYRKLTPMAQDDWLAVSEATLREDAQSRYGFGSGPAMPYVVTQRSGAWQKVTAGTEAPALAAAIDVDSEKIRHDAAMGVVPPDFLISLMTDKLSAVAGLAAGPVREALGRQIALLQSLPSRHDAGVWALPKGDGYYALALAAGAAGGITPEDAHREAWKEIAAINARLAPLLQAQGLQDGSIGARLHQLGQDPRYLYENNASGRTTVLAEMNRDITVARPALLRAFSWLPQTVSVQLAQNRTGWREAPSYDGSKAGVYYVDLRNIRQRPHWSLKSVVHHETLPGHLLQLALQEKASPPDLRIRATAMAYSEGWPAYGEELCAELGLFEDDPLGEIGMWQSVLVRLARQVADTGIHALRWSRERAIGEMAAIAGDFPDPLAGEVDRIVIQPGLTAGQAIGRTAICNTRRRAQKALGAKFSLMAFHDMVLGRGPVPQTMLARMTDRFIAAANG